MELPSVTAANVRDLRTHAPYADLIYVGAGRMEVDGPHNGVIDGVYLCSSSALGDLPQGLDDDELAARLTKALFDDLTELALRECAEALVRRLNAYQGADIWAELIELEPDFERRLEADYPAYVHSEYDRRHFDATATVPEFVALGGRATFHRSRRDGAWHVEYAV